MDKYTSCGHAGQLQFGCLSKRSLFCSKCYLQHVNQCISSRCGNLKKFCTSLSKNIQILRVREVMIEMGMDQQKLRKYLQKLEAASYQFTNYIVKSITSELPRIITSKLNELFTQLFHKPELGSERILSYEKQIQYYIDTDPKNQRGDYIDQLQLIMNSIEESEKQKTSSFQKSNNKMSQEEGKKIEEIKDKYLKFFSNDTSCKKFFYDKLNDRLAQVNNEVIEKNTVVSLSYQELERFEKQDFSKKASVRYGINFKEATFEEKAQALLLISKNLLKEQVYNRYLIEKRNRFPYSDFYLLSTTVNPNPKLQCLLVKAETKMINHIVNQISPSSSLQSIPKLFKRILIMGPELVDISINHQMNDRRHKISLTIYCDQKIFKKDREEVIKQLLSLLDINGSKTDKIPLEMKNPVQLSYKTETERIYCYLKIAKDIIDQNPQLGTIHKETIGTFASKGKSFMIDCFESIAKYNNPC